MEAVLLARIGPIGDRLGEQNEGVGAHPSPLVAGPHLDHLHIQPDQSPLLLRSGVLEELGHVLPVVEELPAGVADSPGLGPLLPQLFELLGQLAPLPLQPPKLVADAVDPGRAQLLEHLHELIDLGLEPTHPLPHRLDLAVQSLAVVVGLLHCRPHHPVPRRLVGTQGDAPLDDRLIQQPRRHVGSLARLLGPVQPLVAGVVEMPSIAASGVVRRHERTTQPASRQSLEDVRMLGPLPVVAARTTILPQLALHPLELGFADDRLVSFPTNRLAPADLAQIDAVGQNRRDLPGIEGLATDHPSRSAGPLRGIDAKLPQPPSHRPDTAEVLEGVEDVPADDARPPLVHDQLAIIADLIAVHPSAVPEPPCRPILHRGSRPFTGELTFELGKDERDVQHRPTHRFGGIKVLAQDHELDPVFLQKAPRIGKIEQRPRDAIELEAHHLIDLPLGDVLPQPLPLWSVLVLGTPPGIDVEAQFAEFELAQTHPPIDLCLDGVLLSFKAVAIDRLTRR